MLLLEALTVCSVTNLKGGKKKSFSKAILKFHADKYCLCIRCHRVRQELVSLSCLQEFQSYEVTHFIHEIHQHLLKSYSHNERKRA